MLGEIEKKVIEDFFSLVENLGQHEELMIESSNKTIESFGFKDDNLSVFLGCAEENTFLVVVLSEVGSDRLRHEEKCLRKTQR